MSTNNQILINFIEKDKWTVVVRQMLIHIGVNTCHQSRVEQELDRQLNRTHVKGHLSPPSKSRTTKSSIPNLPLL